MHLDPSTRPARRNPLRPILWAGSAGLLLLPAVAMYLEVDGVDWGAGDFIVVGLMLATACGLYELGARLGDSTAYRAGFGVAVLTGFLTVWVNLAVGMFGSETHPVNLVFGGVLLVAATGAVLARFSAAGMARAMTIAAGAQLVAVGIGVAARIVTGPEEPAGPTLAREAVLGACFALPWLASALLFRRAAPR